MNLVMERDATGMGTLQTFPERMGVIWAELSLCDTPLAKAMRSAWDALGLEIDERFNVEWFCEEVARLVSASFEVIEGLFISAVLAV